MTEARRIPPHAVDRPALRGHLDVGLGAPLSLLVAPAGAGKSVLLAQWANARTDLSIAWFDITPADHEVLSFAQRLTEGIAAAAPWFTAPSTPVIRAERRLGEPFLEELAARLANENEAIVLVFDDLDRLAGSEILTDLWRLVDLLPPNAHAVFSSRMDLHLGWSRHRLQHGLVEIRQSELAFDDDTTARVLEAITGRSVSEDTAAAVTASTEGWAVGVQLTALSLRFASDPERVVDGMTDTDRRVVDYLSEEVLDALTPERREALKRLAVLDEVCTALVEVVADIDGAEFLTLLQRDSLFIVPVPGRAGWFRFHRLFRDLLIFRLRAEDHEAEAQVLEAAAEWCLAERDLETAVEYLLRAGCWDRVLDLALASGRDAYAERLTTRMARWLSVVPASVRADRLDAELLLAMCEGMSGQATRAVELFQGLLANERLTIGQRQATLAYLAAEVQFHPHPEVFLDVADRALALLDQHPDAEPPDLMGLTSRPLLTMVSRVSRARAQFYLGRGEEARRGLIGALEAGPLEYVPYRVHTLGTLALVEAFTGRLVAAVEHADEALGAAREIGLRGHPAPADAHIALAIAAIQRGEPDAGAHDLAEGWASAASNNRTQLMWFAHLASLLIHAHDVHVEGEPSGPPPPIVRQSLTALSLRRSRMRGAAMPPPAPVASWSPLAFEEIAAHIATGKTSLAETRLAFFQPEVERSTPVAAIEFDLLVAWLSVTEGRRARAREHVLSALARAETEWHVHPFVRIGPQLKGLLDEVSAVRTPFGRFVMGRVHSEAFAHDDHLVDELTPRELELLAYLPSRYTIADIAERCYVSSNTVKTHLGHIYRKLGVAGRDAAIERATELGLLDRAGGGARVV